MVNWGNFKDEYLATRKAKGIRATTDYDTSKRQCNLLRTLSGKPTPRSGREARIQHLFYFSKNFIEKLAIYSGLELIEAKENISIRDKHDSHFLFHKSS